MQNQKTIRPAEYKIGKTLYYVSSFASESAKDTMVQKVNKLLSKDMELYISDTLTEGAGPGGVKWNREKK